MDGLLLLLPFNQQTVHNYNLKKKNCMQFVKISIIFRLSFFVYLISFR